MAVTTYKRRKPTPIVSVGKNQFGRFDCPWPDCPKHGEKGAATEWGVSTHLRRKHNGALPPTVEGTGFKRPSLFTAATRAAAQATVNSAAGAAIGNEVATAQATDQAAGLLACPHCGPRVRRALMEIESLVATATPGSEARLVATIRGMIRTGTDNHEAAPATGSNGNAPPIAEAWQPATTTS